jgi:hypothetical protein
VHHAVRCQGCVARQESLELERERVDVLQRQLLLALTPKDEPLPVPEEDLERVPTRTQRSWAETRAILEQKARDRRDETLREMRRAGGN